MFRGAMLAVIGFVALGYAGRSVFAGFINLGGKHGDFIVTWANQPGLFAAGVIFMLVLGVGALAAGWTMISGGGNE